MKSNSLKDKDTTSLLIDLLIDAGYSEQEAIELLSKFLDENSTCEEVSQSDVDAFIAKYSKI